MMPSPAGRYIITARVTRSLYRGTSTCADTGKTYIKSITEQRVFAENSPKIPNPANWPLLDILRLPEQAHMYENEAEARMAFDEMKALFVDCGDSFGTLIHPCADDLRLIKLGFIRIGDPDGFDFSLRVELKDVTETPA